uniref:Uncharacterized protein n=1 Tax=Rhodnius prolixus TaxID=13249 RepID=T1IBF4_RHOPR
MEPRDLDETKAEDKSTITNKAVKKLLDTVKVCKARYVFQKLKDLSEAATEGIKSYLTVTSQLLNDLFKQHLSLNDVHGEIVMDLNNRHKRFKSEKGQKLMKHHQRKILDFANELNEEIKGKQSLVSHLIEINKKWCSFEKRFNEMLDKRKINTTEILDSTNFQQEQKKLAKKLKVIRNIKKVAELTWSIMSVHSIDYRNDTNFRDILFRINRAKNLSLENLRNVKK